MAKKKNLKTAAIKQWIADLNDKKFGIEFNSEYMCILNDKGNIAGDAALFLAIRNADIKENSDVFAWYEKLKIPKGGYHASEVVVTMFTGIPIEDACKLMWPHILYSNGYDTENMSAKEFVTVLKHYLDSGVVDWTLLLPEEEITDHG